jgi:tRNA 2-selenouridine synthase
MDFKRFDSILDARTPSEYALDHIPGAVSTPVLDDTERAEIGTMYKQVSAFEAKKRGATLVAKNVARHIEERFRDKGRNWRPLVYCWRGGKRSGAMAHILREVGWQAETLAGGYRAYRRWVVGELARLPYRYEFRVIHGATGSGKSRVLRALAQAGAQTLDLEALAQHRGSVLGALPGQPQPSQKWFESVVLQRLAGLDGERPIYIEGESKKIGELQVPDALMDRMRASSCVVIEADVETRVSLLMDEYGHFLADSTSLGAQLDCLAPLHGNERIAEWKALAARGAWRELVAALLVEHYDPAYRKSSQRNFPRLAEARKVRPHSAADAHIRAAARALLDPGEA